MTSKAVLLFVICVCFAVCFVGVWCAYQDARKMHDEVQAFLDESHGVVRVKEAYWSREWSCKVTPFLGESWMPAKPAPGKSPNPGEFWKGENATYYILLVEKTKCP